MSTSSTNREEFFSILAILIAFIAVLGWLAVPRLQDFALQAFAGALTLFFITKRLQQAKIWHVLPHTHTPELGLLTFAFYLLIGATGNLSSPLIPLSFVHTFIVVFTAGPYTAIATAAGSFIFHWYQAGEISYMESISLSIIPVLLVFFLFARRQYDTLKHEEHKLLNQEAALHNTKGNLESLLLALEKNIHPVLEGIHIELTKLSTKNDQIEGVRSIVNNLMEELKQLIERHK